MTAILRTIHKASPVLAITGWLHIALLIAMLAVAPFDHRLILGINPWIKPMKFAISIAIYVWTVAWMLEFLPRPQRLIEWGTASAMIIEMVCIAGQAARGTTSHFNQSTPFDAAVFGLMGMGIVVSSALAARLTSTRRPALRPYLDKYPPGQGFFKRSQSWLAPGAQVR